MSMVSKAFLTGLLWALSAIATAEAESSLIPLGSDPLPEVTSPMAPDQVAAVTGSFAREQGMAELNDESLSRLEGQAGSLILVDRIGPNELTGATSAGTFANNSYYRMGLDAKMEFNLNMSKLQLGCGGVNDLLTGTPACDIDIDYASFMGINATGDGPSPAGPASLFQMIRPFLEIAVKNESTAVQREVVGFRVGAQRINGAISAGRVYNTATANLENGGANCNPSVTSGTGVLGCNSGINSISGFLSVELSAALTINADLIGLYDTDIKACFGRVNPSANGCSSSTNPVFLEFAGTRIDMVHAAAMKLHVENLDLNCFFLDLICLGAQGLANAIINDAYAQMKISPRQLHYLVAPNTENFFISFQRERVSWPNYSKTTPPNNVAYDACNPAYGQATARCSSAYAPAANTGWWLNAPGVKILNIKPSEKINAGYVGLGDALSMFGPEGQILVEYPKLGLNPGDNCYGSAVFC